MQLSELIKALDLVGTVYRNKNKSQPAEPINKLKKLFQGYEEFTINDWIAKNKEAKPKSKSDQLTSDEQNKINQLKELLKSGKFKDGLNMVQQSTLSAKLLKVITKEFTGRLPKNRGDAVSTLTTEILGRERLAERREQVDGTLS